MSYEPRGKVKILVDAMRASTQIVWAADEVARAMEIPKSNVPAYTHSAMGNKVLYRKTEGGKSFYSLQPFVEDAPLKIPTIRKPGDWCPPVMTPPRGATGYVPRMPLPEPLHQVIATPQPPPAPIVEVHVEQPAEEVAQEEVEPIAFDCRRWLDGDIDLYGLLVTDDGGHRITADQVPGLLKLLGSVQP